MPCRASPPATQRLPVEKSVEVGQLTCLAIHFWRLYQSPRCVKAKNLEACLELRVATGRYVFEPVGRRTTLRPR